MPFVDKDGNPIEGDSVTGLKIGEKILTESEISDFLEKSTGLSEKAQKAAAVLAAAEKYGVDPETYVGQAEGAFGVMSQLIEDGIIDNKGNVISKSKSTKEGDKEEEKDDSWAKLFSSGEESKGSVRTPSERTMETIQKGILGTLAPELGALKKAIEDISQTQNDMLRIDMQKTILSKFDNLKEDDVSRALARAQSDRTKTIMQHAEDLSNERKAQSLEMERTIAKKYGIDIDEFEKRNKLREEESKSGAAALVQGKKISFRRGKDNVSPKDAAKAYFEHKFSE